MSWASVVIGSIGFVTGASRLVISGLALAGIARSAVAFIGGAAGVGLGVAGVLYVSSEEKNSKHARQVRLVLFLTIVFGAALSLVLWMIIGDTFPLYVFTIPFIASVIAAGAIYAGQRRASKIKREI